MRVSWDEYFINISESIKHKSKDESTQIGAVISGDKKQVISTGYNSFPRGINDDLSDRQERPEKYYWMSHAETNAIINCALNGVSSDGGIMHMSCGVPCADCARNIINAGIKEIVCRNDQSTMSPESIIKWEEASKRSLTMFKESGVKVRYWN